jgi:hypothetical protein
LIRHRRHGTGSELLDASNRAIMPQADSTSSTVGRFNDGLPSPCTNFQTMLKVTPIVDRDVHPRVIMRILRRADQAVTMEIYANASSAATSQVLRRLGEILH